MIRPYGSMELKITISLFYGNDALNNLSEDDLDRLLNQINKKLEAISMSEEYKKADEESDFAFEEREKALIEAYQSFLLNKEPV